MDPCQLQDLLCWTLELPKTMAAPTGYAPFVVIGPPVNIMVLRLATVAKASSEGLFGKTKTTIADSVEIVKSTRMDVTSAEDVD